MDDLKKEKERGVERGGGGGGVMSCLYVIKESRKKGKSSRWRIRKTRKNV